MTAVEARIYENHKREIAALQSGDLKQSKRIESESKALLQEWDAVLAWYKSHVAEHRC